MLNPAQASTHSRLLHYVIFAALCVFILAVHSSHFHDRSYRQDEAWRAHLALERDLAGTVQWSLGNLHPPLWQLGLDVWVSAFGHTEIITRFFSTLWTALTLALVFRLGSDLFERRVGLLAVFLLGSLAFFQFYAHETRPYVTLVTATTGAQIALLRWIQRPALKPALAFVLAASAALYIHFFSLFFIAALASYFVLFVRWHRALYLRALILFAAVGLSFVGWLPSFLHSFLVMRPGGIDYALEPTASTLWDNLVFLFNQMSLRPAPLGDFLLLLSLVVPVGMVYPALKTTHRYPPPSPTQHPFRFGIHWPRLHVIALPAILLALALVTNSVVSSLTPRNLIVILPSLAVLVAFGMRSLHWRAQAALLLLLAIPFLQNFRAYVANGPYREIIAFMTPVYQADDPVLVDAPLPWQHVPLAYYLRERLTPAATSDNLFHLMYVENPAILRNMPTPPVHLAQGDDTAAREAFAGFVRNAQQVWHIEGEGGAGFHQPFLDLLNERYLAVEQADWGIQGRRYPPYIVTRYRRLPDELATVYGFGEAIGLQHWALREDVSVQPCQSITLESWWQAGRVPDENYSLTLTLAGADGVGIARSDGTPAGLLMQQWQPEQLYLDERSLQVPCDTPPGEYPLLLGLYNFETGEALPATLPDGATVGALAYLTTLFVQ